MPSQSSTDLSMTGPSVSVPDMMEARERRLFRQTELRQKYPGCTVVSFTMNIAGPVKNTPLIRRGFEYGCSLIRQQLMRVSGKSECELSFDEATGNEGYFIIDLPAVKVKRLTVEIEDHDAIGRLFDMDVLDETGRKLDRGEIGLSPRRCLLCGQPAAFCARSRTHTVAQLQERTAAMLTDFVRSHDAQVIARDACRALLYEVCTTPKPGLVDRDNPGSHRDMDIFTFLDSAAALLPYFRRCAECGMDSRHLPPSETFRLIRQEGVKAERDMYAVTCGVNTHKGAVFSMGILCAALGRVNHSLRKDPAAVLAECGRIAEGISSGDFASLKTASDARTAGERLYLEYGIRGVRGQAEDGFPAVLSAGLPALERELAGGASLDRAGSVALLSLLAAETDTNLIARGGRQKQLAVTEEVRHLLAEDPSPSEEVIREMDRAFISENLSPGGSADLLGLCYMLHFMKDA